MSAQLLPQVSTSFDHQNHGAPTLTPTLMAAIPRGILDLSILGIHQRPVINRRR
jgi:hypothetical protein